jgi:hypothetical protein
MTEVGMAMDPVTARIAWTRQMEYHLGLVPLLLRTAINLGVVLSAPHIPVSRGGSQFDRPQITGGGYYDSTPTLLLGGDARAADHATYLWELLAEYATAVSEWLGADTTIPPRCPNTATGAHDAAMLIVGTLLKHTTEVWEHRELEAFEQEMFTEIRRQQRRLIPQHDGLPQHARHCTGDTEYPGCGSERSVRVRWEDDPSGSPKPRQVVSCRVCGHVYSSTEGETDDR